MKMKKFYIYRYIQFNTQFRKDSKKFQTVVLSVSASSKLIQRTNRQKELPDQNLASFYSKSNTL